MYSTSAAFRAAAAGSADPVYRVSILNSDLSFRAAVQVEDGQVRVDGRSVIRRTATATVDDSDGRFNPAPDGLLWWDRPWLVEMGFVLGGEAEYQALITGYPDEPDVTDDGSTARLVIPFRDRLKLADASVHQTPMTFAGSMRVQDVIRAECEASGMGTADSWYDLDDGGVTLDIDHTYEQGRRRLDVMIQLAADNALDLYVSPLGVTTLRPTADPTIADIVASYRRGAGSPLLGLRKRWTPLIKNRAIVVGVDRFGDAVRAEVADTNADSPYSVARIGDQPDDPYVSLGITTQEQAVRVATARLPKLALIVESLDLAVPLDPSHEANDIIEVVDANSATEGRHILDSFAIGLNVTAAGALSVRKVRALA